MNYRSTVPLTKLIYLFFSIVILLQLSGHERPLSLLSDGLVVLIVVNAAYNGHFNELNILLTLERVGHLDLEWLFLLNCCAI